MSPTHPEEVFKVEERKPSFVSRRTDFNLHAIRPTLSGTVIAGDQMTMVRWVVEPGQPVTALHSHETHEQFTIMIEGAIETTVGDEVFHLQAGDVCRIPRGTTHGRTRVIGTERAVLIDVFEPVRQDYLAVIAQAQP